MSPLQDHSNQSVDSPLPDSPAFSPQVLSSESPLVDQAHSPATIIPEELLDHGSAGTVDTTSTAAPSLIAEASSLHNSITSEISRGAASSTVVSRTRPRLPGAFYSVVPGVLFLTMGIAAQQRALPPSLALPASTRADSGVSPLVDGNRAILSVAQTLVMPSQNAAQPIVWRTRLQPAETVVGRAPISGQITSVWVRAGQSVNVGDRVMRIASYQQATSPMRADTGRSLPQAYNSAAEEEQVKAVRAQGDLSQRLSSAQARLKTAQTRVARAQTRVNEAMAIVQKLQSGAADDSQNEEVQSVEPSINPREQVQKKALAARVQQTQAAAERANAAAEKAEAAAGQAAREAARAEAGAERKTRRAAGLRQTRERDLAKIAVTSSSPAASSSAPESADADDAITPKPAEKLSVSSVTTAEIEGAENEAREATLAASTLRAQARRLSAVADKERARAQDATSSAREVLRSLRLFSDANSEKPRIAKSPAKPRRAANLPSIEEAARIVKAASDESRAANREAERWKSEVEEYSRQAKVTQQRIIASEQNLGTVQQQAQQQELDTVIQRNLSIVRAPTSGTVLRVNGVGDNVSFSDSIVLVGKEGGLRAQFVDTTGLWRNLKAGATVSAVVQTSTASSAGSSLSRSSTRIGDPAGNAGQRGDTSAVTSTPTPDILSTRLPVTARIESIEEPVSAGKPALIRAVVPSSIVLSPVATPSETGSQDSASIRNQNNGNTATSEASSGTATRPKRLRLRSGMPIELVLNGSTSSRVQALPREAFVELSSEATQNSANNEARAGSDSSAAATSLENAPSKGLVAVLQPAGDSDYVIEWRQVEVKDAGAETLYVLGLSPGERVALPAVRLRTLALNNGVETVVSLR